MARALPRKKKKSSWWKKNPTKRARKSRRKRRLRRQPRRKPRPRRRRKKRRKKPRKSRPRRRSRPRRPLPRRRLPRKNAASGGSPLVETGKIGPLDLFEGPFVFGHLRRQSGKHSFRDGPGTARRSFPQRYGMGHNGNGTAGNSLPLLLFIVNDVRIKHMWLTPFRGEAVALG